MAALAAVVKVLHLCIGSIQAAPLVAEVFLQGYSHAVVVLEHSWPLQMLLCACLGAVAIDADGPEQPNPGSRTILNAILKDGLHRTILHLLEFTVAVSGQFCHAFCMLSLNLFGKCSLPYTRAF